MKVWPKSFVFFLKAAAVLLALSLSAACENLNLNDNDDPTRAQTPVASPGAGSVGAGSTVTLSTATPDAAIYYTIDGSVPDSTKPEYTVPITIEKDLTVKAVAIRDDLEDSKILEAAYAIDPTITPAPKASAASGPLDPGAEVTLSAPEGAEIYYTIDGSAPDTTKTKYTGPITINAPLTIKAIAAQEGLARSALLEAAYTLKAGAEAPAASPAPGAVPKNTTITLSAAEGAEIYYTTDGSAPYTTKTKYASPIIITRDTTIKALAAQEGMAKSAVLEVSYTIAQAAAPTASLAPGAVALNSSVTLATATEGAEIRYTTNGSAPTASSRRYTAPVTITQAVTIKAISVKSDLANSDILEAAYTIDPSLPTKASTPAASPEAGATPRNTAVTLSTEMEGAEIYYTTDGTAPNTTKTKYEGPITITAALTIRAIAVKAGLADSDGLTAAYTIARAEPPVADLPAGAVLKQPVHLSTPTGGAEIYYTLDGTAPDSSKTKYTAPISVTAAVTLKAIAVKADLEDSAVFEAVYTILKAETPAADPASGAALRNSAVTLFTASQGAEIYYTTDGTAPDSSKTKYTAPISVSAAMTLKAIAVKADMEDSAVLETAYTIMKTETPRADPAPGAVPHSSTVTLSSETGAEIYYTTDGSSPDATKTKYTTPISVSAAMTIKAIAIKANKENSDVLSAAYSFARAKTPVAEPPSPVLSGTEITLSTATEGAEIYYTTDGSSPDETKTKYTAPISVSAAMTIKAVAVKDNLDDSEVLTAVYAIKAAAPTASPGAGEVALNSTVTLSTTTEGAKIYYTTDGTTPSASSAEYTGPITIDRFLTLKAVAVKEGLANSDLFEAAYTVPQAAKPSADPPAGTTLYGDNTVTLTTDTEGAKIYYTTDGTTPSASSAEYTAPITAAVGGSLTIKAIAVKAEMLDSPVFEAAYTVILQTEDISFVATADNSSALQAPAVDVVNETRQSWTITVKEKATTYFAVNKEAGQTITVTGTDADRVTQAANETTVDGSTAGDELAVFAVDTEKWDPVKRISTLFEGGEFAFDLEVVEDQLLPVSVGVTVKVVPDLTGVAVFTVEGEGDDKRLARAPDLPKWKGTADQKAVDLIDAIAWVDTNHDTDETGDVEYLIRVEHNEQMPRVVISCRSKGYTEIRLRGVGTPTGGGWEISHDGSGLSLAYSGSYDNDIYAPNVLYWQYNNLYGVINLHDTTWNAGDGRLALALEDKVTLKGVGLEATPSTKYGSLVHVKQSYRFIMRNGSRVTGHNTDTANASYSVIYLDSPSVNDIVYSAFSPMFKMEGGAIDNNKVFKNTSAGYASSIIQFSSFRTAVANTVGAVFSWTGGQVEYNYRIEGNETRDFNKISFYCYSTTKLHDYDVSLWNGGNTPDLSE
jgi:hypothetical protein